MQTIIIMIIIKNHPAAPTDWVDNDVGLGTNCPSAVIYRPSGFNINITLSILSAIFSTLSVSLNPKCLKEDSASLRLRYSS